MALMSTGSRSIPHRGAYLDAMASVEWWVDRILAVHFCGRSERAELLHAAVLARMSLALKVDCLAAIIPACEYSGEFRTLPSEIMSANDLRHLLAHAPEIEGDVDSPLHFLRLTKGELRVVSMKPSELAERTAEAQRCSARAYSLHQLLYEDENVDEVDEDDVSQPDRAQ
jgi:hypothetical protein